MRSLDEIVNRINCDIESNMSNVITNGIVRSVTKSGVLINYDYNEKQIVFDDKSEVFLYHKSLTTSFTELQARGSTKTSQATSSVDLYVYSKKRNTEDFINAILSKYKEVTLGSLNTDSDAIFKREVGADKFNPSHYVFVLSYQVKHKVEDCLKNVCNGC